MQCLTRHVSVIRMTNRRCELITSLAINRLKSFSRSLSILHGISDSDEVTCTCLSVVFILFCVFICQRDGCSGCVSSEFCGCFATRSSKILEEIWTWNRKVFWRCPALMCSTDICGCSEALYLRPLDGTTDMLACHLLDGSFVGFELLSFWVLYLCV